MNKKDLLEKLSKLDSYSEEAISAVETFISDYYDNEEDICELDQIIISEDYDFIYFADAEEYLKSKLDGFFTQSLLELAEIYKSYNICELAGFILFEEIGDLINELMYF